MAEIDSLKGGCTKFFMIHYTRLEELFKKTKAERFRKTNAGSIVWESAFLIIYASV